jgi:hypothetical protein
VTAFRPATAFTNNLLTDIIATTNVYALERMPTPYSNPNSVGVRVTNVSGSPVTFDVILTVKDVATSTTRYTQTQTVTALAGGAAATATFTGLSPTLEENVNITATTSVIPGETYTANNTMTISGEVNPNLYSYNYNTAGAGGYGFTAPGSGIFASKFTMNGTGQIRGAKLVIANDPSNTGKVIFAVLLNSAGAIVKQSPNYTILSGDLGTNKYFAFPSPQTFNNQFFYVGLAQTANATQYYPLGWFNDSPIRANTFYSFAIAGGTATAETNPLRYGIEAVIVRPPTVVTTAATAVAGFGATLNATISANTQTTTVLFQYSTDLSYGSSVAVAGNVTTQLANVSANVTGLQPNTLYNFRAVATNADGTTTGNSLTFTTAAVAPVIVTKDPTSVNPTYATLNGNATAYNASTAVSFEYGTTLGGPYPNIVAGIPSPVLGNTATDFSATVNGLAINTDYYYRAIGLNVAGTTYGAEKHFFTTCVIPVAPGAITGPAGGNVCKTASGYIFSVAPVANAFVYNWTFPAGFSITSYPNSNSVIVSVSGAAVSGSVTVTAQSDCGAVGAPSPAFTVTVRDLPIATVAGSSSVCQSTDNTYSTQPGNTTYVWSVSPDGTITPTANPDVVTINWGLAGPKTVGVIYTNGYGCTTAAPGTLPVTVKPAPVPVITGVPSMCVNSGYYDYTTDPGMTGYVWTVSEGGTITSGFGTSVAQVVWNTPGARFVTVNYIGLNGCLGLTPTVFNVTVNGLPGSAGTISGSANVCFGAQAVVYTIPAITNAITYIWTLPAGATIASGDGTNSITVNFAGNAASGDITVQGNSLCGNGTVSAAFHVTIIQAPAAAGAITGDESVCAGAMGVAYSIAPVANATGYVWDLPAGATIATGANTADITVDFSAGAYSGNITVFGTNPCANGVASPALPVTMKPRPAAPFIYAQGDSLFSNMPDGNQWYYGGTAIVGGTGHSILALYDGWYWDRVTVDGCESDTSNNIFIGVIGISEQKASGFVVYPVPNDGLFKLSMNSAVMEPFSITISNNIGITVYTRENVPAKGELVIDLRPVSSGVYTMIIRNSNNKIVKKIIVNR